MAVDAAVVSEEQVPASFSSAKKIACPLRLLDCFSAADSEGIPCSLDALEPCASSTPQRATLRVRGVLLEPDESQEPRPGAKCAAICASSLWLTPCSQALPAWLWCWSA